MPESRSRRATIEAVSSYLPQQVLTNDELAAEFGTWDAQKIYSKTGISERRIAATDECVSDIGVLAAQNLAKRHGIELNSVEFLIFCTQTPDYLLPSTACLVQDRLSIDTSCAAFDINLGCSGYIYALGIANAFVESGMFERGLVITADTYSKVIHPGDRSIRTIFGDGATATLVRATKNGGLGPFIFGTDGSGTQNLIIPAGGTRLPKSAETAIAESDSSGNVRSKDNLYMNGPEIFIFSLVRVPEMVDGLLQKARINLSDVDLFIFHQANKFILDHLMRKMRIPEKKMYFCLKHVGNTVSSSIPIAIEDAIAKVYISPGQRILMASFGVGYSWGACLWSS